MLLDSSGLLCLLDARERRHGEAVRLYRSAPRRLTHNYVLAEFVALTIARRVPNSKSLDFVERLVVSGEVEVIWVDEALHLTAFELLKARLDKSWSLCDAVSFVLMQQQSVREALTTDHHFEQAGFTRLLDP
jgi:predicted nucleic acid-binding protein